MSYSSDPSSVATVDPASGEVTLVAEGDTVITAATDRLEAFRELPMGEHRITVAGSGGGKGTGVTFSRKRDLPVIAPALNNVGFLASASDNMIKDTIMLVQDIAVHSQHFAEVQHSKGMG